MTANGNGAPQTRFQKWMSDGIILFVVWLLTLITYIGFRLAKVDAPELFNAFVGLTGIWLSQLGLAQGRKVARVEQKVEAIAAKQEHTDDATKDAIDDAAEKREGGKE
jgi:hypothetical protein